MLRNLKLSANLVQDKFKHGKENESYLILSLEAPNKDWKNKREPIAILPVVDISGSMDGEKLNFAKKSATKLVEYLKPTDYSGLVVFADNARTVSPMKPMTDENKTALVAAIASLRVEGCTNLCEGMLLGFEELNKLELGSLRPRVVLLTDGLPNRGLATSLQVLRRVMDTKISKNTMSCFGYGDGADQDMLLSLSESAQGNFAFIKNPEDALGSFAKELGGLLSTYAQNVKLNVLAMDKHELLEVISQDVEHKIENGKLSIKLADILSEEVRNIVVKVKLASNKKQKEAQVFDIKAEFDKLGQDFSIKTNKRAAKVLTGFVMDKQVSKPDDKLMDIVNLAVLAKAQKEAAEQAKQGNYSYSGQIMQKSAQYFTAGGYGSYASTSMKLGDIMGDAGLYGKSKGTLANFQKSVSRGMACSMSNDSDVVFDDLISGLECVAANSAQTEITEAFIQDDTSSDVKSK